MNLKWKDATTFLETYHMKEDLVQYCRELGLSTTGSKLELTQRIAHFIETKEVLNPVIEKKAKEETGTLSLDQIITLPFTCGEDKRAFFKEYLGETFYFAVVFQKWIKANEGKTYRDAIEQYPILLQAKKSKKLPIDRQFEYNTYIRDFFADNEGKQLQDAIVCWKYKKAKMGSHQYEASDLIALTNQE